MTPPTSSTAGVLDTRAFAVIADADELLRRPALLATFAAVFGPRADATLVLTAADVTSLGERFAAAAASVGPGEGQLPAVRAVGAGPLARVAPAVATRVHAVLTEAPPAGA